MFRRILSAMVLTAVAAMSLAFFAAGGAAAQTVDVTPQRISFAPGATSYVLTATLVQGVPQSYLLGIRAGQTLWITENGSATVQVLDPLHNSIAGPVAQPGPWGTTVTMTGDHMVTLAGSGAVTVVFYIPPVWQPAPPPVPFPGQVTRIWFPRGASSTTFGANLTPGIPAAYLLRLGAGQQMFVTVNGNATASLLDPWGGAVQGTTTGAGQWQYPLRWTGDYRLVLQGAGQVGVTVYVPPIAAATPPPAAITRIRFHPGNASTSFTANLVLGTPSRYILGMAAGQTLYIEALPEVTSVTVTGPGGTAVSTVHTGRPGLWSATGWQTGDYIITIQGQGATGVTVYIPPL